MFSHLERYKRQDSGVTTTDHLVLLLLQDVEVEADVVPGVGRLGVRVDVRVRGEDTERADPRYLSLVRRPGRQRHRHSLRPGRGRGEAGPGGPRHHRHRAVAELLGAGVGGGAGGPEVPVVRVEIRTLV